MVMHVEAGLTPAEVIEVATRNAAVMMDQPDRFGGVTEGMAADLLILDADPRQNIVNIREIRHVIRGGQLVQ
jgi:imidazolonepropionase-like amidohydrolase